MIIATAGHVDHGKTTLVKALTGVDTDRLPEEKKRGLTIDLGFAYVPAGEGVTIGFVDVPGHERFVHNMLCGVAGIDAVLFIVAADDGLMPQTREHLAILDLLEVRHGLMALTKTDRVPPERVAQVNDEIAALTAGTTLAGMPVFPVSAHTGAGMAELKEYLYLLAHDLPPRGIDGNFRLSVDRSFTLSGAGLIVTGTVVSGRVEAGAQVRALLAAVPARVRSIHAQNAAAPEGHAGQRCALNLAGSELKAELMHRGDWIVQGNAPPPVPKLDARLCVLPGERALRHWTPVHVHIGAADVTGRVAVLEGDAIAPGASGLVQLVLDRAVGAAHGDRLIIRDQSARRTIAGGRVIDVFTPPRGRAKPARIAYLRAMELADHAAALAALLQSESLGLDLTAFVANRNLTIDEAAALFGVTALRKVAAGQRELGFLPAHWVHLRDAALAAVASLHQRLPDAPGIVPERLLEGSSIRLARDAVLALGDELVQQGHLARTGTHLRLPNHQAGFNPADAALWARIAPIIERAASRPPVSGEIAAQLKLPPKPVQALLERAARRGLVTQVGETRFFSPATVAHLAGIAQAIAQQSDDHRITPLAFRDQSALGRNLAVEVLEYFDRAGYTRRVGDSRLVLKPASEVFGGR